MMPIILIALAATLCCGVWGLYELSMGWRHQRVLASRGAFNGTERNVDTLLDDLDRRLSRTDIGKKVGKRISGSGVRIRVSTFLILLSCGVLAAVLFIGEWMAPLFGIVAAGVVGFVFFAYLRRKQERRKEEFTAQLPELARVLSNATQAGLALRMAIEIASEELDDPARTELKRTSDALKLGQPIEAALRDLEERMPSRELGVLISTLIVSARAGGSLVKALRGISTTLEERKETRREVKTIIGETVVSNWAIGGLGVAALVIVRLITPEALAKMSGSLIGEAVLGIAFFLFTIGLVIISRISRIDI